MTHTSFQRSAISHTSLESADFTTTTRTYFHPNGVTFERLKYVFFLDDVEVRDIGTTEEFRVEGDIVLEAAIEGSDEDDDGGEIKQKNDEQK